MIYPAFSIKMSAGKRLPDVVELENLARLFGKPLDWLATWHTQLKTDEQEFGFGNDVGLIEGEFQLRIEKIKQRRARWKYYKKEESKPGREVPPVVPNPVPKTTTTANAEKLTTEHAGKARAKGIRLFRLAGKPTKEQFQMVYGEHGHSMTWAQRAAAGVPAEKFQEALKAKRQAKQTAITQPATSKVTSSGKRESPLDCGFPTSYHRCGLNQKHLLAPAAGKSGPAQFTSYCGKFMRRSRA